MISVFTSTDSLLTNIIVYVGTSVSLPCPYDIIILVRYWFGGFYKI